MSNPTNKEREAKDQIYYFAFDKAGRPTLYLVDRQKMSLQQAVDRTHKFYKEFAKQHSRQFVERVLAELPKKRPVFTSTKSGSQIEVVEGKEWNEAVEACRAAIASQLSGGEEQL